MRGVVLNERLNTSEMMALDKHGKEAIDRETEYFKKRGEAEPRLWAELYSQPHPYQWMIDNNATARLHEEIGTDPAAYEARLRAKWEAERAPTRRRSLRSRTCRRASRTRGAARHGG